MKILNRYIFKELLSPFLLSLFILIFVLLTQFLVKHLDRFLGKDLPFSTILKFLVFNSASIISLAAPMAVLVATMMTFGRLSSDNEITGFKASGISHIDFLKPGILFGIIIVSLMIPFNLWILPEMNHNIRKLSYQISKNRPDIEIKENMLNSIYDKMIFVGDRINKQSFSDIVLFDKNNNKILTASQYGKFIDLNLKNMIKFISYNPLLGFKVMIGILYEAFKIVIKGGKFYARKKKPNDTISFEGNF